jgi:benzoate transport
MSWLQIVAVAITIALNALDGFDIQAISFAAPGLTREWGITKQDLGWALSMELIGMAVGSILLGGVADLIGRRKTILGCLTVMAGGMYMASTVSNVVELSVWRLITGLGIGGMLAAINAVAAEFSSAKRKNLCVALMAIGYPVGAVLGGMISRNILKSGESINANNWREIFLFGSICTAALIPLVVAFVPESVHWLARKQPAGALDRINKTLKRFGQSAIAQLPDIHDQERKRSIGDIFAPGLAMITILITGAYFFHITTFYFIVKWTPNIVVDMNFAASAAGNVLVWVNVGGATGGALLGLLGLRFGIKTLTAGAIFLSAITLALFGRSPPDLQVLATYGFIAGLFSNAGIVGMYALFAHAFPTHVRAFGTGFAIGIGRGGAVLAPLIGGYLFAAGYKLPTVAMLFGVGAIIASILILLIPLKGEERTAPSSTP